MYAKIFTQIFDSSIAEDYQVRLVFEDLLKLADPDGVVDMTPEALSRRTNVPLEIVLKGIAALEAPDRRSRNPNDDGIRIKRLDKHRDWGWIIVNHAHYRNLKTDEERRADTRSRVYKYRARKKLRGIVLHSVTGVTQRDKTLPSASASASASASEEGKGGAGGKGNGIWHKQKQVEAIDSELKRIGTPYTPEDKQRKKQLQAKRSQLNTEIINIA